MPSLSTYALFITTALALLAIPGPAVLYVVSRSIDQGRRAGLASVLGITSGTVVHVTLATVGLSSLVLASTVAFDADHTNWSSFQSLSIQAPPPFNSTRVTNWKDTWAWRVGMETDCGAIKCRAGYYRDKTPMPLTDVGPVLPDANRQALTAGIGVGSGRWSVDLAAVYVMFDDRTTTAAGTDQLAGTWKTTGSEVALNFHWR